LKKIVFINNLSFGGAERVVSRLLSNSIVCDVAQLWTLDNRDFYKLNLNNKKNLDKGNLISTAFYTVKSLLALTKNDLVQAHLNKPILFSGMAKLIGANFSFQAVHCFSYSSFYSNKGVKGLLHKFLFEQVLKRVDFNIFKSKEMVDDFEYFLGWRPKNHTVIYNPYEIENILMKSNEKIIKNERDIQKKNIDIVGLLNK
jgi:N-acetylgalactosamine-N,N'-diacetylbacillosaminyl-diphospho-undecaprenol 4-alpha-N-acetylgalactosaminyltransferase